MKLAERKCRWRRRYTFATGDTAPFRFVARSRAVFELRSGGEVIYSTGLWLPMHGLYAAIDPTCDRIDEEADHFLLFLARQLASRRRREFLLALAPAPCAGPLESLQ